MPNTTIDKNAEIKSLESGLTQYSAKWSSGRESSMGARPWNKVFGSGNFGVMGSHGKRQHRERYFFSYARAMASHTSLSALRPLKKIHCHRKKVYCVVSSKDGNSKSTHVVASADYKQRLQRIGVITSSGDLRHNSLITIRLPYPDPGLCDWPQ